MCIIIAMTRCRERGIRPARRSEDLRIEDRIGRTQEAAMGARTGSIVGISLGLSLGLSLLAAPALAQIAGSGAGSMGGPASPTVPPALSPSPGLTGQAPVGHFQPRRDAVPEEQYNPYKESPEDKALDQKIKSICRGC
jgi:hypothetical protein